MQTSLIGRRAEVVMLDGNTRANGDVAAVGTLGVIVGAYTDPQGMACLLLEFGGGELTQLWLHEVRVLQEGGGR